MSFKPLHSLLDQQQSVVVTGNRRIAPAGSKPGSGKLSLSVPGSSKPGHKIQLPGGQVITVTDLQDIFQGNSQENYATSIGSPVSSQGGSQSIRSKKMGQQGTYAKRLQAKQQQQQQAALSSIVLQNAASTSHSFDDAMTSTVATDQKPFAFQLGDSANSRNSISYVTVMENEETSSQGNREEVLISTNANSNQIVLQDTSSVTRGPSLVMEGLATDQPFGQIIYQQDDFNETTVSTDGQTMIVDGGSAASDAFNMNVVDFRIMDDDVESGSNDGMSHREGHTSGITQNHQQQQSHLPSINDQSVAPSTTTVLIPSSTPGGEPQRLVIPTSTLLQITGQSSSTASTSTALPTVTTANIQNNAVYQRQNSTVDSAQIQRQRVADPASFVISPSKNPSNFVFVQKPPAAPSNGVRFVPITAAPTHSIDTSRAHDSFELNGTGSPLRESSQQPAASPIGASMNAPPDASLNRNRKPCNCTKSQCLKLYCDCFANGEFCFNCNCTNCHNNLENEETRQRSIKQCLDRNPYAFHPKIGKSKANGNETRRHAKGCNCKKSGCLKNYCECYEAKIPCTSHCKCVGCKNFDENDDEERPEAVSTTKTTTATATGSGSGVLVCRESGAVEAIPASRFIPQIKKLEGPLDCQPSRPRQFADNGQRQPFSMITQDVVEATMQCMLASCRKIENRSSSSHPTNPEAVELESEAAVVEELGRCLRQIINAANKTAGLAPSASSSVSFAS